eukprot:TRINITY_DN1648_c0_g1_i1.p1 TRINITY_DN1648_c0_g1~~TRINITY_DN1648_c0_g1_i1.p1  ORF type:complete len:120 (-),score=26.94 TRINITY_DN1648_c0_g1_i1:295-654(-)
MELAGCGGGLPQFSNKERFNKEKLLQAGWQNISEQSMAFEYNVDAGYHQISDEVISGDGFQGDIICLPEDMWSRVKFSENGIEVESGVYLTEYKRIVGRRVYEGDVMVKDLQGVQELVV